MPDFLPTPPLLDGSEELTNGSVFARASTTFGTAAGIVTTATSKGVVKDGILYNEDESGPFAIAPATTTAAPMEIVLILDSWRGERMQTAIWTRTVIVPNTATVSWNDLVDVVPPASPGSYVIPVWVTELLEARAAAAASAAAAATSAAAAETARAAAVVAKTAAQAVPTTTDGLMKGVLGNAASVTRVQEDARLSATYAPKAGPGSPIAVSVAMTIALGRN
ncbi:hypothetical protein E3O55_08545 [Cryobacterium sp. MDB1-18-2]|uniref:hypothetical protein n=1 Tax=unclassified Cryobacterium TaxID=2649013 RepID=UPI00106B65E9|nr:MULTISPECIES: hypothetical protein [unclassified Cryobacterium]TFC30121.1 hypothetical protein E3O55_08545 [Cryobacterium sp. MDB1-18-2]TFC41401.1 hypothetical protein E3O50_09985 [Cryobacterium sp. MDB1-18-1]